MAARGTNEVKMRTNLNEESNHTQLSKKALWIRSARPTALPAFHHVACFVIHLQTLIWNRSDIDDHERVCEFSGEVVRWICVRKQPHVMMGLDTGPEGRRRKIALLYFAEKRLSFWPHHLFERFVRSIRMKTPTQRIKYSVWNINECQELLHRGVLSKFEDHTDGRATWGEYNNN